jgi:predicted nucleic acid-binding protein
MILVDSDILIEVARGRDAKILAAWAALSASDELVLYSPVTCAELWAGSRPSEHQALESLFRALQCAPIDAATARRAGDFMSRYRKSHSVELGDALIAATAALTGSTLWTRNRKHYPMPGIAFFS